MEIFVLVKWEITKSDFPKRVVAEGVVPVVAVPVVAEGVVPVVAVAVANI